MNGSRGITRFQVFTAAGSAGSPSRIPIAAAACWRTAACWPTTSYPDRTSPVLRGKWLLDNIFGLPVPPPPPGVDTNAAGSQAGRRAADHSRAAGAAPAASPSCSSCHSAIDPPGFALENFDAIGGWRTVDEAGRPVDASRDARERREHRGLSGLRAYLLAASRPVSSHRHRKTTGVCARPPARVLRSRRLSARSSATRRPHDYRWSSLILGIVKSPPFLMRKAQEHQVSSLNSQVSQ